MKAVIQRVSEASVTINGVIHGNINHGMLILLGIQTDDNAEDIEWLCSKIINLRIFSDENAKMNLSIKESQGAILLISQFTLLASTKKGNRPSFVKAANPFIAIPFYNSLIQQLETGLNHPIQTGVFGADMKVHSINDGPLTILLDSKLKT